MVDRFTTGEENVQELEETFNDQAYSDYYVVFLRLLVSAYIQRHASFYINFIEDDRTIRQFCESEVEPMSKECDNIHVAALALSTGVPIRVENCQQSGDGIATVDFPASEESSTTCDEKEGDAKCIKKADDIQANGLSSPDSNTNANVPDGGSEQQQQKESESSHSKKGITLLYRPGHYDVLYLSEK